MTNAIAKTEKSFFGECLDSSFDSFSRSLSASGEILTNSYPKNSIMGEGF
jgi:hypothetical protein